jgi:hypothetical protein
MSYVRCYDCGAKCYDPAFVRQDVQTHGGVRRVNLCYRCAGRRNRPAPSSLLGWGVLLGAVGLCCGAGSLFLAGRQPTTSPAGQQAAEKGKDKTTAGDEARAGRQERPGKDEVDAGTREKGEQEQADRLRKQSQQEERVARERQERKDREEKAARLRAIVERLQSDEREDQLAALKEALPVAPELPEPTQARALELLKFSADPKVGAAAFAFLCARKAEKLALPVLANHLDSENTLVRRQAVDMLAHLRPTDPKVIAKLVDALDDKDTGLRAATTLGKIGKPAVAALRAHLKSDLPDARRYTVVALSYMGPEAADALPDLEAVADHDTSPTVRAAAHTAIKRIKGG